MTEISPPKGRGALARREARLAWGLLLPTITIVALVVIVPLLAIFWISAKPVKLGDLRPAEMRLRVTLRDRGDVPQLEYRVINPSRDQVIHKAGFTDTLPQGVTLTGDLPQGCALSGQVLNCDFGDLEPAYNERFRIDAQVSGDVKAAEQAVRDTEPTLRGSADNVLTNATFTLENFTKLFDSGEFWSVFGVTLFYTVFGTLGALVVGLFAAMLLNKSFRGQGILRGLYLFPYVAPVIAVAFTWITLFDPFSGSANALLVQMGVSQGAINFFGQKPLALIMVTLFEVWRYFPLSFLFILARMQSIDSDMYEAADMDGASPFQKFWYLSLPQLLGILSVLFLLRFIWTFNKFDDIFLLTGGNAGTRTLTVNVYEQAFAVSNIGAGAAVAVVVFGCLLVFSALFFRTMSREEGL
ncbi:carbohydrate ABC transporter permease [Thioclava atlantica]|uniref:Binding-protein-dependent transport system inner membrane protein n=1 Tax=Thioclava atlantica TaxID=1317124 RepID=A0A085TTA8_9RHOB|nr:sugar ABC transporter permease [Thioclava atlantica]KFE33955.1 binding-protein-dependent transport system inner membrane protein [Thioclava atlantica]